MYAPKQLRIQQYFVQTDWRGDILATPSLSGCRLSWRMVRLHHAFQCRKNRDLVALGRRPRVSAGVGDGVRAHLEDYFESRDVRVGCQIIRALSLITMSPSKINLTLVGARPQ